MTENLERAKVLQSEKNNRSILDKYEETKKINNEIIELNSLLADKDCPSNTEISQVKSIQRTISSLENKLCGMNITAAINMMNGNQVEVTSLRTGEVIDVSNGIASITESVKIVVCGVLEMQLSPADVDVESIKTQIEEQKNTLAGIYKKYGVVSLEELETLSKTISGNRTKLENAEKQLDVHLEAASVASFEELKKKATAINGCIRSMAEIERDILALCDKTDISTFITRNETIVDRYTNDYGNVNNLNDKAARLDKELEKTEESISGVEDIPAEYLGISDPNAHLEKLGKDLGTNRHNREEALKEKTATATKLENYKKQLSGDPEEDAKNAQRIFEEQKSLLSHWMHIAEVFKTQKENIQSNPMEDIAERFSHYLGVISGGKVESDFPEPDKLNMKIYSDKKLLDYGKLSEGTKETVALAFRLAVLDHLFPDGGGVIVFDDPFTDMDADRTKQSCELIRECAKRHQVIFLTCKEEYADMLPGNEIRM